MGMAGREEVMDKHQAKQSTKYSVIHNCSLQVKGRLVSQGRVQVTRKRMWQSLTVSKLRQLPGCIPLLDPTMTLFWWFINGGFQ